MSNIPHGGFRPSELIVISSEHHKLSGWNSTMFVDQVAKHDVSDTINVLFSDCNKSIIGETEKAHINDLIEKSLFKDCRIEIHLYDNYQDRSTGGSVRSVTFWINAQPGTFRFYNRMYAYYSAYARLACAIDNYLNPKTITPLDDSEYQLRKSVLLST